MIRPTLAFAAALVCLAPSAFAAPAQPDREDHRFMAANANASDVVVLPGLQYQVLTAGSDQGGHPSRKDTVRVRYKVTFTDGKLLDSSATAPDGAVEFPLGSLIPAWTTAIPLMRPGDKWRIWSPAEMAYGEKGSPPDLPPNSVLIFEVELISFKPTPKPAEAKPPEAKH